MTNPAPDDGYDRAETAHTALYLWPCLGKIIESVGLGECNVFEIGSGKKAYQILVNS
jgi:hypothetical protein